MITIKANVKGLLLALLCASPLSYAKTQEPGVAAPFRGSEERITDIDQQAQVLIDAGNIEGGIRVYDNFLKQFPKSESAMIALAALYGSLDNYNKQVEYSNKALAIKPDDYRAHLNLGEGLLGLKKNAEALVSLNKAFELADTQKDVKGLIKTSCYLSYYYDQTQESAKETIKWADECIGHLPEDLYEGKGLPEMPGGEDEILGSAFQQAYIEKARAYARMNDYKEATDILEKFLRMYPKNTSVADELKDIKNQAISRK